MTERRSGSSRLVYDKERRTIVPETSAPSSLDEISKKNDEIERLNSALRTLWVDYLSINPDYRDSKIEAQVEAALGIAKG